MAITITWADVIAVAPELAVVPTTSQDEILAIADRQVNADSWGVLHDDGMRYLCAHLGTMALRRGSGPVASETVGPLSRSYVNMVTLSGLYGATPYGVEYRRLIKLLPCALGQVV
jgi:hypothetical protein